MKIVETILVGSGMILVVLSIIMTNMIDELKAQNLELQTTILEFDAVLDEIYECRDIILIREGEQVGTITVCGFDLNFNMDNTPDEYQVEPSVTRDPRGSLQ